MHLSWLASPRSRPWDKAVIRVEDNPRNSVRKVGSEGWKRRLLTKGGYQTSYHCGHLGHNPTGELWEMVQNIHFRVILSEEQKKWGIYPPHPSTHGLQEAGVCGDVDSLTFWPALVFSRAGSGSQRMLSERDAGSGGWMSSWLRGHDECGEERQGLHLLQSLTLYLAPRTRSINSFQLSLHL